MSSQGFGKGSGPNAPPKSLPDFGNSPRPLSASPPSTFPPFSGAPRLRSPSQREVLGRIQSHHMAFQHTGSVPSVHQQSAGVDRVPVTTQRMRSPSLAFESSRSAVTASYSHPSAGPNTPILTPPRSVEEQKSFLNPVDARNHPSPGIASASALQNSEPVVGEVANYQMKRTRSPSYMSGEEKLSRNYSQPVIRRPVSPSPTSESQPKLQGNYANSKGYQDQYPSLRSYDQATNIMTESGDVQAPERSKSPELPFASDFQSVQVNLQRPFISPPRSLSTSNGHEVVGLMKNIYSESGATKPVGFLVPKRTRTPPLPSSDQVSHGNSYSIRDDNQRERLAKAKRLARFKEELGASAENNLRTVDERDNANKNEHLIVERNKYMSNQSRESSGNLIADDEDLESSKIVGLCPDMCPESERAERERKGDLDHYERLDGDRNQTSKNLAVKKYNRTAEREANLIRPMPILVKTIDYLLNLLSQPYDEKFLGIYNFLWDRMRAIRMDLRMQHLFNEDSITMLEQMIRLHIIAMHELCEFSKGEGFAEGFDAHLNIEQMNKTSVELFQMYDDHRKRGINVPSEKEFRGYYALLKLDKHPGYKVEPAELSLDLAKMTPEMRHTPEVKFARDVARACRMGNFIAFFRLARKASYLQACLMHAHFAKLRTQALASLHSGLQNNQGLPIAHVSKWIGMEEEEIEDLLEYHGFQIKVFEEPYMVREGPFLNNDKDYATKCSKLVHMKRSRMIVNDISSCSQNKQLIPSATKQIHLARINKGPQTSLIEKKNSPPATSTKKETSVYAIDEEMAELAELSPKEHKQVQQVTGTPIASKWHEYNHEAEAAFHLQSGPITCAPLQPEVKFAGQQSYDALFMTSPVRNTSTGMGVSLPIVSEASLPERLYGNNDATKSSEPQSFVDDVMEDEEHLYASQENKNDIVVANDQDEEIANAKLKLILRLWRRRSLKKKQLREQRLLAADAALNTLSLGPLIQLNKDKIRKFDEFDIDHAMSERRKKQELSWSILNVSDVVANTLSRKNLDVKCICWKLLVCSQMDNGGFQDQKSQDRHFAAGSWLHSKLMPSLKSDDLVVSSRCLSIWKNWVSCNNDSDLTCYLCIVKDTKFDDLIETVHGSSAVLFLVTASIPMELQRAQLHKLLMAIPSGSCLPLLILSDLNDEEVPGAFSMLANRLGLYDIDKSRISSFQVVSLLENPHLGHLDGFFSDEKLKEGLKWLANESAPQPVLHCLKMLDLVTAHLNSSAQALESMKDKDVGPNNCISAFNIALDQSLLDITAAAMANPSNWPCPEVALLESSDEYGMLTHVLPSVGWSSAENIEPLKQALMSLKLPAFPDDMSWLAKGSNMGKEIPTHREKLENSLIRYLTQSSEIMGLQLATQEAGVMLQNCAKLELRKFDYFIVPDWVTIFRRIFNWRLRYLADRTFSSCYIADCCHAASPFSACTSRIELESSESQSYHLDRPLLDEIIGAGCSSLWTDQERQLAEIRQPPQEKLPQDVTSAIDSVDDDSSNPQKISFVSSENVPNLGLGLDCTGKEIVAAAAEVNLEAVKLSKLLERCNLIQNAIDKKLSIYF